MIYLYGASGHAKVIIEMAEELSIAVLGLIDANPMINELLNYPVSTTMPTVSNLLSSSFVISIGNNRIRKEIAQKLRVNYITIIHPKNTISSRSEINEGTVIMAGVTINSCTKIGKHVIINTNASIDHDCIIEDFVHISPNAALAGNVHVGEGTHVGIGASIIQGIKIGNWCTIGAGSVIIRDIPDYAVVVGNPARIIKMNQL